MATLKQIRARIKAAKNIQQITKAMKLVAAARLKKATDRVLEARPYADKLRDVMGSLAQAGELPDHPLMQRRDVEKIAIILLTSDRGLAGPYNTTLLRKVSDFLKETKVPTKLVCYGKKGQQFFGRRGVEIVTMISAPAAGAQIVDAVTLTNLARDMFVNGEADAIYICYAKFFSAIRQVPQMVQVLPIEKPEVPEGQASVGALDFSFEPSPAEVLDALLPRYLQTLIWQAMLEATASEFGARMTAMTSATDNAGKMIYNLTLKANRERQAGITKEILEVVGGAEALKG